MDLPEFPTALVKELQGGYGTDALTPFLLNWYRELSSFAKAGGSERLADTFARASRRERHPEMARHQNPVDLYVPGLGRKPFFRRGEFAFMRALERHHATITRELVALREKPRFTTYGADLSGGAWLSFHFWESGHRFDEECSLCPETAAIIEQIPGHEGGLVGFFALTPGGKIDPHYGMHNAKARGSMGLLGCEGAYIQVGGEIRTWREGVCLALDDSYSHRVWHQGPATRFVLLMDLWHPDLTPFEVKMLDHYYTRSPIRAAWLDAQKKETHRDPASWWTAAA
jgi:aspartyl/asparaginyl beta-hydroxylase (cupin superfamily)